MSEYKNECIAWKGFCQLILDREWPGCPELKIKPGVFCRVLIDGWFRDYLSAESREAAIEKFNNTEWR